MARLKRTSAVLEAARRRLAGLKAINPKPNFGPNVSEELFDAKITSVSNRENSYNQKLTEADAELDELQREEAELNDLHIRVLAAGAAQFGTDSKEYEMLGGTRKSERKKPTKKGGSSGSGGSDTGGSGTGSSS